MISGATVDGGWERGKWWLAQRGVETSIDPLGQPGRTPEGRALDEVRLVPVARVAGSGNSKIGQLDQAVERDQNIGGLDVPVMVMIVEQ